MAAARAAVCYVAARPANRNKSQLGSIHLRLHVKPGVNKTREGVAAVSDQAIELFVAAQPMQGEANKAVLKILSQALDVPPSRLELIHGLKSRDKTAVLRVVAGDGEEYSQAILGLLKRAGSEY